MKKSITTLLLGISAAGTFTTATAASITAGPSVHAPAEAKHAAPAPNGPAADPNEESEN
jgi:hypothetical protein